MSHFSRQRVRGDFMFSKNLFMLQLRLSCVTAMRCFVVLLRWIELHCVILYFFTPFHPVWLWLMTVDTFFVQSGVVPGLLFWKYSLYTALSSEKVLNETDDLRGDRGVFVHPTWDPHRGSSFSDTAGPGASWWPPEEQESSARRSVSVSSRPEISTADTLTEKRAPAFSLRSSITLKSQEMAVGATPRLCVEQSWPIMV